jgi:hypothetical protein
MRKALNDPRLLGNVLAGPSWDAWRALLIACVGEKLTAVERETFRRFTGRAHEPNQRVEEAVFLIGRRGGKDRALSVLAAYLAALMDWSPVLAKGETALVLCIGPDQRQAKITRDYVEGVFAASPILSRMVVNKTAEAIELSNGVSVETRAASFRRLRGVTCVAVIATEAAFWHSEDSANLDSEILNAVRPSLATTSGPLIIITTPYARRGEVWNTYRKHFGPQGDPLILVAQGTSRDFNPTLSQKVIDRALERDPAAASAEYLAQFRSDIESFVSREVIDACITPGQFELPPVRNTNYVAFVDPAGGSGGDSMTLAIAHRDGEKGILDCLREVRSPFSPDDTTEEFAAVLKLYGIQKIQGDRYANEWPREAFRRRGISYEVADKTKSELYKAVLPLLNSGQVELLDNARLTSQLTGLERRTAWGGKDSIDHAPGNHDDVANAAAGALVAVAGQLTKVEEWNRFGANVRAFLATHPAPGQLCHSAVTYAQGRSLGGW